MGMIRDVKAASMAKEVAKAWEDGEDFFTPVLNLPSTRPDLSGAITDWPPMLSAITGAGWKLHTWVVASDSKGRAQAMPLFAR